MASSFIVVPQWQGSVSSRAMQLADGAEAIRGDLPQASTTVVPVPLGAGSDQGSGVHRLTAIQRVREQTLATLATHRDPVITIGGDCGVALAPIEHILGQSTGEVAVVWLDAHPDLNTPENSPSGAFSGMVLRTILGDGAPALLPSAPLDPGRLVLAGTRALDAAESEYIASTGIRMLGPAELSPATITEALTRTGASSVYLHIDLDVLDPGELACLGAPVPFGVSTAMLIDVIRAARAALPLAGATIAAFAPGSSEQADEDLPTILRIIAALTAP